ncbi:transmembrane signal receptor [Lithospermum erythrorhizon]|uniref:Transmembrane signal receptor n=1 Tax=Lithospermum erythrorhizon TaxID=34254 RepID=A0AAV3RZY5_LITER
MAPNHRALVAIIVMFFLLLLNISHCASIQTDIDCLRGAEPHGLDLSNNMFNGTLPSNISRFLEFVVNLDLSSNQFSGEIPVGFANCTYLNNLNLDSNQFTGQIPPLIGQVSRIKLFSVANNKLNGPVPNFSGNTSVTKDNYANNAGLCGGPLPPCQAASKRKTWVLLGDVIRKYAFEPH